MIRRINGQNLTVALEPRGGCELYVLRSVTGPRVLVLVLVTESLAAVNKRLAVAVVNVAILALCLLLRKGIRFIFGQDMHF